MITPDEQPPSSRLDHYVPRYQWQTQHSLESSASRESCYKALVNAEPDSMRVSLLLNLRGLQSRGTLKESFLHNGFTLLEESPPDAFIVGLVCKPWVWGGEIGCYGSPEEWLNDNRVGFARIATVLGTEEMAGKTRYWMFIKPFSGFIRRAWLHGAKRKAEQLLQNLS